ncbi:MAG: PorT family protein [Saprospiraceae bacterium]|nr:PorT family protein [Saprospiraceae bacterium]
MNRLLLSFSFVASSLVLSQAQEGWEVGGWLGASHYFGDLNTNFSLNAPGFAAGAVFRYNFNNRIALKFSGNYGQVSADDASSKNIFERSRNLSFQSNIWEMANQIEFNFMPYTHGSRDEFFTPYLFGGFNVYNFNPKAIYQDELVELRPLGTEGQFRGEEYYSTQVGLVYGGGIKLSLNSVWSINVEISARYLMSDYFDDVSTIYADPDDIANLRGPVAAALSNRSIPVEGVTQQHGVGDQRGNAFNNDSYVLAGVSLLYYFGDLKCPKIVR